MLKFTALGFCILVFGSSFAKAACVYPYTLTNGTTADATQVMANFAAVTTCVTGYAPLTSPVFSNSIGIDRTPTTAFEIWTSQPQPTLSSLYSSPDTGALYSQLRFRSEHGWGDDTVDNDDADIAIVRGGHSYPGSAWTHDSDMVFKVNGSNRDHQSSEVMRLTSQGYLGIGTSSPSYMLYVNGTAFATGAAGQLSDIRHKKSVAPLPDGALPEIMRLRPVSFYWRNPIDDGMRGKQMGFIAQEVENISPSIVFTQNDAEKTKGLKYNEIVALLTKAVQEQQREILALKAENDDLEKRYSRFSSYVKPREAETHIRSVAFK